MSETGSYQYSKEYAYELKSKYSHLIGKKIHCKLNDERLAIVPKQIVIKHIDEVYSYAPNRDFVWLVRVKFKALGLNESNEMNLGEILETMVD